VVYVAEVLVVIQYNICSSCHKWAHKKCNGIKGSLSSRKTMRQYIMLVTQLSFCTVGQFISSDTWPANSPNLNPHDYHIWGMMQVYRVPIRDTDKLGKHLVATWTEFQQSVVDDAVDQWRKRLEACILAVTSLARHSSCHISQLFLFRATNANPQLAVSRATNILRNATLSSLR